MVSLTWSSGLRDVVKQWKSAPHDFAAMGKSSEKLTPQEMKILQTMQPSKDAKDNVMQNFWY
jgi:hypothetical protein